DNCGTSPISVSGTVDANTPGTYTLNYAVNDPSGNAASTTRAVIVGAVAGLGEMVDATTIDPTSPLVLDGGTLQNDSGGPVELENEVVLLADSTIAGNGKVTLSGPVVMEKDITLEIKTDVTIKGEINDKEKALELTKIGAKEL